MRLTEKASALGDGVSRPNDQTHSDSDILTAAEVAVWLRVTPEWVRAHANRNRRPYLPGFKAGKYVRFRRGTIRDAINKWEQTKESA
jgi:hypothetical protein